MAARCFLALFCATRPLWLPNTAAQPAPRAWAALPLLQAGKKTMNTFAISPCTAVINLGAIKRNYQTMTAHGTMMPVIKSDAYGHGMLPVAAALGEMGARHFAVGIVEEGLALRAAGHDQSIVTLLGGHSQEDMANAYAHRITPLVHSFDSLQRAAACGSAEKPFAVGIKCNTGMTRLGFEAAELPALLDALRSLPQLKPVLALSHFACSDMPQEQAYTAQQLHIFAAMSDTLRDAFPEMRRSLANSAATLSHACAYELCRPGIVLYGGNPFYGTEQQALGAGLEWAMSLKTPVLQVREIEAGASVGYGRLFTASRRTRVAVLPVGYADGFARASSTKGKICLHGQLVPQIGRVCMGMIMVDVSSLPAVHEQDEAWILGGAQGGAQGWNAQQWADVWGSIPYEVLCLWGRNKREYYTA